MVSGLVLAGCGGSDQQTITLGGSRVEVDAGDGRPTKDIRSLLRRMAAVGPYRPWYRACIVQQVSDQVSPADFERLAAEPPRQQREELLRLIEGGAPDCEMPGKDKIDPNASAEQFEFLRGSTVVVMGTVLLREGFPAEVVECVRRGAHRMGAAELTIYIDGTQEEIESVVEPIIKACDE